MSIAEQIRSFIKSHFHVEVSPTDSLLDSGLVDSVGIFELVSFLEEQFGVRVADEDIVPEHFETVSHIESFLQRMRGASTV